MRRLEKLPASSGDQGRTSSCSALGARTSAATFRSINSSRIASASMFRRILRDENLIVSRQGSGVFVRERTARPVGLRPHIEAASTVEKVRIDFSGYTAETFATAMQEPIDKIRDGRLTPRSIELRLPLADTTQPIALPSRAGNNPGDDQRVRDWMARTAERYAGGIRESLAELAHLGLVDTAEAHIRVHPAAPLFKIYLLNASELFFGFYPVVERTFTINDDQVPVFDPMGKDTALFHHVADNDPDSMPSRYVSQAAAWFDSIWGTIARPSPL